MFKIQLTYKTNFFLKKNLIVAYTQSLRIKVVIKIYHECIGWARYLSGDHDGWCDSIVQLCK